MTPDPTGAAGDGPRSALHLAVEHQDVVRLRELLDAGADLRDLLRDLQRAPEASELDDGAWRGVVWQVTFAVQCEGATLDPQGWALCSRVVLDVLARAVRGGAFGPDEALVRRLHLTAFALGCVPRPVPGVPLLDAADALGLALAALPADVEQVARDAARWRDLPREQVLRLRRLKNLLTPALAVADRAGDGRLDPWRAVHPRLP